MAARIVHSQEPFNAEPTLARLRAASRTAQADFYTRSHGDVPALDPASYALEVAGLVRTPLSLSLDAIRDRFAQHEVEAVLQCAGNRRADLAAFKPVCGDPWAAGAIGNARWTGVRLRDVLDDAGASAADAHHVCFTSHDTCDVAGKRFRYSVSIPMAKARAPEVLLATAMNGEPLAPEHGFPLRVITPGYAGVRSPKWLATITIGDRPSDCPIQAEDYKLLPQHVDRVEAIDWAEGVTIDEMPVNSAICEPAPGACLEAGLTRVRGWAMASGRPIVRVDVSADGGRTWMQAVREDQPSPWSWCLWTADLDLPAGKQVLVVRAWDAAGQTQPSQAGEVWNVKGYLSAAWHRVPVIVG